MTRLLLLVFLLSGFAPLYAQEEDESISTEAYHFESWTRDWIEPLKEAVVLRMPVN